jgi:hypothetical protein
MKWNMRGIIDESCTGAEKYMDECCIGTEKYVGECCMNREVHG